MLVWTTGDVGGLYALHFLHDVCRQGVSVLISGPGGVGDLMAKVWVTWYVELGGYLEDHPRTDGCKWLVMITPHLCQPWKYRPFKKDFPCCPILKGDLKIHHGTMFLRIRPSWEPDPPRATLSCFPCFRGRFFGPMSLVKPLLDQLT